MRDSHDASDFVTVAPLAAPENPWVTRDVFWARDKRFANDFNCWYGAASLKMIEALGANRTDRTLDVDPMPRRRFHHDLATDTCRNFRDVEDLLAALRTTLRDVAQNTERSPTIE